MKNNKTHFMFRNRLEAGIILASKLNKYKKEDGIVLAIPRGGIPVAYAVAKELDFPLELVLIKKIGHPMNKEYAIGAAGLTDYFVIEHENVSKEYINQQLELIRSRLKEMQNKFIGNTEPLSIKGKTVIIVDDGIATGNTLLQTIKLLKKSEPAKIVIAVPVASDTAVEKLSKTVNEIVAVVIPEEFYGVGAFYEDFEQVNDDRAMIYINRLNELRRAGIKVYK